MGNGSKGNKTDIHMLTLTVILACMHALTCTHAHTHMHTCTHSHAHMHALTHTNTPPLISLKGSLKAASYTV